MTNYYYKLVYANTKVNIFFKKVKFFGASGFADTGFEVSVTLFGGAGLWVQRTSNTDAPI
jgi:hypothetical protein